MNFDKNLKAFLKILPLKNLSGHEMFLAIAIHCSNGKTSNEITVSDIKSFWLKSLLKRSYNSAFYSRAQQEGWVNPARIGIFRVSDDGIQHISNMSNISTQNTVYSNNSGLYIFEKKSTHSFDKFLRGIFAKSKSMVLIADSWVDETIFDNIIDSIPKTIRINLLYAQKKGTFDSRVVRFKKEYQKFTTKRYSNLHDRFLIVDSIGYIIGPSIKDAASNSPALVVSLNKKDSNILLNFFQSLWAEVK